MKKQGYRVRVNIVIKGQVMATEESFTDDVMEMIERGDYDIESISVPDWEIDHDATEWRS